MKSLDPKAVWWFFILNLTRWTFVSVFIGVWSNGVFNVVFKKQEAYSSVSEFLSSLIIPILVTALVVIVVSFVWAKLTYRFYKYELTDLGFKKELGVIYKKYVTIPYDRIQNVDINRGILARILGLSDLNIQTAGASTMVGRYGAFGSSSEGQLPALPKEVAEKLRDELVLKSGNSRRHGL